METSFLEWNGTGQAEIDGNWHEFPLHFVLHLAPGADRMVLHDAGFAIGTFILNSITDAADSN